MAADAALTQPSPASAQPDDSSISRNWRIIFKHRAALICLLLVTIHQCIVAISTVFLTRTITLFQSGQGYFIELCLYLTAMAIPYIPGCVSFVLMQRWVNAAHHRLVREFELAVVSKRVDYRDASIRENVTAVLARNSFPVVRDYISFIHDLASFSLNSILSVVVIVFLLPAQLAGGYCLSLFLCFLIVMGLRKSIAQTSSNCEYAYLRYSGVLDRFWPNAVLGNTYNSSLWRKQREAGGHAFYATSHRLEVLRQSGNILLAAASLGPTIFLVAAFAQSGTAEPPLVAALIVSLTRIFLIVNSLSALVHRALDYSSLHARVKVALDALTQISDGDNGVISNSISISVNGTSTCDAGEAKRLIATSSHGRFTITGPNGSGKSTFLLSLKQECGAACFLLPSDYSDLAWEGDHLSLATRQRLNSHLNQIFKIESVHYILLDEWDANLDASNTQHVDDILCVLAKNKVIVEVRHRRIRA